MNTPAVQAEVGKLAFVLGVADSELAYLAEYDAKTLRDLRELTTTRLFDADRNRLAGVAAASKLMPVALTAKITERTFPPQLAARVAGLLEPARAVDLATRLPVPFLADLTPYLDPRRISGILADLPPEIVVAVAGLLGRRRDYISMGRFVGHLDSETIAQTMAVLDDETVLRIGPMLEDQSELTRLIALLPDARLGALARAGRELDIAAIWQATVDQLDPVQRQRVLALSDQQSPSDRQR